MRIPERHAFLRHKSIDWTMLKEHHLMVPMANQVYQHAERGLPFDTDWEQASLMGSLPTGLVHCFPRLTVADNTYLYLSGAPDSGCLCSQGCLLVD